MSKPLKQSWVWTHLSQRTHERMLAKFLRRQERPRPTMSLGANRINVFLGRRRHAQRQ